MNGTLATFKMTVSQTGKRDREYIKGPTHGHDMTELGYWSCAGGRATTFRTTPTDRPSPPRQDVRTVKHTHTKQAGAVRPEANMTTKARALKTPPLAMLKKQAMTEADQADAKACKASHKVTKAADAVDRTKATLDRALTAQAKARTEKAREKAEGRVNRAAHRHTLATDRLHEAKGTLAGWENRRDDLRRYWGGRHPVATQKYRDGATVHLDLSAYKYRPRPTHGHEAGTAPYAGRSNNLGDKGRATVQYLRAHPGKVSEHNLTQGVTSIGATRDLTHTIQGRVKGRDRMMKQATRAHPVRQSEATSQALRAGGQSPYLWWALGEAHRATVLRPTGDRMRPLSRSEYDAQYGYPRTQAQAIKTTEALMGRVTSDNHPGEGYTLTAPEYSTAQLETIREALNQGPYCIYLGTGDVCDRDLNKWAGCEALRAQGNCFCGLSHEGRIRGATEAGYVYQARPREVYEMARLEAEILDLTGVTVTLVSVADAQAGAARIRVALGVTEKATPEGLKYRGDKADRLATEALSDPSEENVIKAAEALTAWADYEAEIEADREAEKATIRKAQGKARRAMRAKDKARPEGGAVRGREGPRDAPPATIGERPLREPLNVTPRADPERAAEYLKAHEAYLTERATRWAEYWTRGAREAAPAEAPKAPLMWTTHGSPGK